MASLTFSDFKTIEWKIINEFKSTEKVVLYFITIMNKSGNILLKYGQLLLEVKKLI